MAEEKNFENRVKAFLADHGCFFIKYLGSGMTKAGVPDLLVCCNGYFLGVEIKATHGTPRKLQYIKLGQIVEANGYGFLLYPKDYECFKHFVIEVINGTDPADLIESGAVDPLILNWYGKYKELKEESEVIE